MSVSASDELTVKVGSKATNSVQWRRQNTNLQDMSIVTNSIDLCYGTMLDPTTHHYVPRHLNLVLLLTAANPSSSLSCALVSICFKEGHTSIRRRLSISLYLTLHFHRSTLTVLSQTMLHTTLPFSSNKNPSPAHMSKKSRNLFNTRVCHHCYLPVTYATTLIILPSNTSLPISRSTLSHLSVTNVSVSRLWYSHICAEKGR